MILKLRNSSKCISFCKVLSQSMSRNIHASKVSPASDKKSHADNYHNYFVTNFGKRVRKAVVRVNQEQIEAVRAVFKKYNVDISNLDDKSDIFYDTPWEVEKRIMLLEELGTPNITTEHVLHFRRRLQLPVNVFKAHLQLSADKPMYENLFLYMDDHNFDPEEVNINEDKLARAYLHECLIYYTKKKLKLNKTLANKLKIRNDFRFVFHSFRLFSKLLQFLQNDVMFTKSQILKHHTWLFSLHPDQLQTTYNIIEEITKERTLSIVQRYPPIFEHNLEDLKIIVSFLKEHVGISKTTAGRSIISIFQTTSEDLKKRFDYLSKNCFTQDFLKHPKFINLIASYHCVLARLRYLEENNLQYVTIHALTNFMPNYYEELVIFKSLNKNDIKSFFYVHFGDDAEKALQQFKKHMYYRFVPLLALKKSLVYLRGIFPSEIVTENSYAILYNQKDLQAAYEVVTKNLDYCNLPPSQLLSMCLYTIELNSHFTGDPILAPGKYAESLIENVDQDKQISDTKEL